MGWSGGVAESREGDAAKEQTSGKENGQVKGFVTFFFFPFWCLFLDSFFLFDADIVMFFFYSLRRFWTPI